MDRQVQFTRDDHIRYEPDSEDVSGEDLELPCLMASCSVASEGEFIQEQGLDDITDAETLVASTSDVPDVCTPYSSGEDYGDQCHKDMKAVLEGHCNPSGIAVGNAYQFLREDGVMTDLLRAGV